MEIRYPAIFTETPEGSYGVEFLDLPGALTEGVALEETLFNAAEALSGTLDVWLKSGRAIPAPTHTAQGKNVHFIAPGAKTQAAMRVRISRSERKLADLARALDASWPQAQRLEDPSHWPSLCTLEGTAHALGKRLILSFV